MTPGVGRGVGLEAEGFGTKKTVSRTIDILSPSSTMGQGVPKKGELRCFRPNRLGDCCVAEDHGSHFCRRDFRLPTPWLSWQTNVSTFRSVSLPVPDEEERSTESRLSLGLGLTG